MVDCGIGLIGPSSLFFSSPSSPNTWGHDLLLKWSWLSLWVAWTMILEKMDVGRNERWNTITRHTVLTESWDRDSMVFLWYACVLLGCFRKWWYPQNTPKWSFLVGKPMVVGYHHFRKHPYGWDKRTPILWKRLHIIFFCKALHERNTMVLFWGRWRLENPRCFFY